MILFLLQLASLKTYNIQAEPANYSQMHPAKFFAWKSCHQGLVDFQQKLSRPVLKWHQTKKLIKEACLSSNAIAELVSPLRKNSSTQEEINFQISVPYYGGINFHSDLNLFSRIVYHDKELYTPEGKLSLSSCDRSYSVLLFDSELNLINEINLQNLDLWERALATSNGYVVPGKCSESSGEDYFEYNVKYEFLETNH